VQLPFEVDLYPRRLEYLKKCYSNSHEEEFCRILVRVHIYITKTNSYTTRNHCKFRSHHKVNNSASTLDEANSRFTNTCVSTFYFLAQSTAKSYNTPIAFICISAKRHVNNSVFNKCLNNQAGISFSVLSVLCVSPEDDVKSHRNKSELCEVCCAVMSCCVRVGPGNICENIPTGCGQF
jgi:hypothetical protein